MTSLLKIFSALLFLIIPLRVTSQDIVYMIDNSGSMSGYYSSSKSNFKRFIQALIKNTSSTGENSRVYLFSKTEQGRGVESPRTFYNGPSSQINPGAIVSKFDMVRGKDNDLGRTDLIEAIDDGISALNGKPGIVWLITDNINDNTGIGDSSYKNTLQFYERLRSDANIRKILLYPVPEALTDGGSDNKGYVCYGIVYSQNVITQQQLAEYDTKLRASGIKQKPITLKPLDIGTITLKAKVTQSKITGGKLYFDGKALRGFDFEEGEPVKEVFNDISLKSNLFPYTIKSARLNVRLENFNSSDYSVKTLGTQSITPSTVSNVTPEGEVSGFAVTFNMPEISPNFSFNTIFKEDFTVGGNLILEVTDVDIVLDERYIQQFNQLFALQEVPQIFRPEVKDKKITTAIPMEIRILYGPWRMMLLIGMIAALVLLTAVIIYLILKKTCFTIKLSSDDEQAVCITMFSHYTVSSPEGIVLGKITKGITGGIRFTQSRFTLTPGSSTGLSEGLPVEIRYEDHDLKQQLILLTLTSKTASSEIPEEYSTETYY